MLRGLTGTILWTCLAGAIGVGLFYIKHEVKEQERLLAGLNKEIQREQEAIHVLKAEWSYLNDPTRLRALSEKHLGMRTASPAQVATLDSIARPVAPAFAASEPTAKIPSGAKPEPKTIQQPQPTKPPQTQTRGSLAAAAPPPRPTAAERRPYAPSLAQSELPFSAEAR